MVHFSNTPRVKPIFTLPRFAGGSSLPRGEGPPRRSADPPTGKTRGRVQGEAYPCGTFETDRKAGRRGCSGSIPLHDSPSRAYQADTTRRVVQQKLERSSMDRFAKGAASGVVGPVVRDGLPGLPGVGVGPDRLIFGGRHAVDL